MFDSFRLDHFMWNKKNVYVKHVFAKGWMDVKAFQRIA
jgi:hypothetical protein